MFKVFGFYKFIKVKSLKKDKVFLQNFLFLERFNLNKFIKTKNFKHYNSLQTVIPSPNGIIICSTLLSSETNLLNSLMYTVNLS